MYIKQNPERQQIIVEKKINIRNVTTHNTTR